MSSIIEVRDLTKSFNEISAVDHLDFTVEGREIYGFLGQNGAGKSTTIRMLLSLVKPSLGSIKLFGLDLYRHRKEILKRTGAIIEKPDVYKYLTAFENLKLFAILSGISITGNELMEKLDKVGLKSRADSKVSIFSQGMKQRLGIAVALIHDPELIILDEPMNGLDPQGIADIRKLIVHLSKDLGKTIFISSHLLSEMEQVADSLLIIHKGKKIVEGKMQQLLNPDLSIVEIETDSIESLNSFLDDSSWKISPRNTFKNKLTLKMSKNQIPDLISSIGNSGIPVFSIQRRNTLEDYFLSVTSD